MDDGTQNPFNRPLTEQERKNNIAAFASLTTDELQNCVECQASFIGFYPGGLLFTEQMEILQAELNRRH